MEKKMTYATAIDKAINGEVTAEVIDRLNDLKASLAKRSENRSNKKSAEQDAFKVIVMEALETASKPVTVTELLATGVFDASVSAQKVTAMLKKMVAEGTVIKTPDKKHNLYSVAEGEVEEA
jgi:predicted transcriptional regulator